MKRLSFLLAATFVLATAATTACEEDGGGGANACEEAGLRIERKYEDCGIELQSGEEGGEEGGVECTDALATQSDCIARCTEEADCIALDPMAADPTDQAYLDAAAAFGECSMECT